MAEMAPGSAFSQASPYTPAPEPTQPALEGVEKTAPATLPAPSADPVVASWKSDPAFMELPSERQNKIAANYFQKNIADGEFQGLPPERQAKIIQNFMSVNLGGSGYVRAPVNPVPRSPAAVPTPKMNAREVGFTPEQSAMFGPAARDKQDIEEAGRSAALNPAVREAGQYALQEEAKADAANKTSILEAPKVAGPVYQQGQDLGLIDTGVAIGQQFADAIGYHVAGSIAATIQGTDFSTDPGFLNRAIEMSDRQSAARAAQLGEGMTAIPGLKSQDVAGLGKNLSYSAPGMAAGIGAGLAAAPAGPLASYAAGTAASAATMYRQSTNQFVRELRKAADAESVKTAGRPLMDDEFRVKTDMLAPAIMKYGLHEAGWETAGNLAMGVGFGFLKPTAFAALTKAFGTQVATAVSAALPKSIGAQMARPAVKSALGVLSKAPGIVGGTGAEVLGEAATQIGQQQAEVEAGLRKEAPRRFDSPDDWKISLDEVLMPTLLQVAAFGGAGAAGMKLKSVHDRLQQYQKSGQNARNGLLTENQAKGLQELNDAIESKIIDPQTAADAALRLLSPTLGRLHVVNESGPTDLLNPAKTAEEDIPIIDSGEPVVPEQVVPPTQAAPVIPGEGAPNAQVQGVLAPEGSVGPGQAGAEVQPVGRPGDGSGLSGGVPEQGPVFAGPGPQGPGVQQEQPPAPVEAVRQSPGPEGYAPAEAGPGPGQPEGAAGVDAPVQAGRPQPDGREPAAGGDGIPGPPDGAVRGRRKHVAAISGVKGEKFPVHYELRELNDLRASHNPLEQFRENPDYPAGVQDRPYATDQTHQDQVHARVAKFDPSHMVNTGPTAETGPSVITRDGYVLGGNSRKMILDILAEKHPDRYQKYIDSMKEEAAAFGLRPEDVDNFAHPVLVRALDFNLGEKDARELGRISGVLNKPAMTGQDKISKGVAAAKGLSKKTISEFAGGLSGYDTLRGYLDSPHASQKLVPGLEADGVLDMQNRAQYLVDGKLTPEGKDTVEAAVRGFVIPDNNLLQRFRRANADELKTFDFALPHLAYAKAMGENWISPIMSDVIDLFLDYNAQKTAWAKKNTGSAKKYDPDFYLRQPSMMPDVMALRGNKTVLEQFRALVTFTPREFAAAWKSYAESLRELTSRPTMPGIEIDRTGLQKIVDNVMRDYDQTQERAPRSYKEAMGQAGSVSEKPGNETQEPKAPTGETQPAPATPKTAGDLKTMAKEKALARVIEADEKINGITRDEAGAMMRNGDKDVLEHIAEGVKTHGTDVIADAIRNQALSEVAQTPKGPERDAVSQKIASLEPDINKILKQEPEPWEMTYREYRLAEERRQFDAIQGFLKKGKTLPLNTQYKAFKISGPGSVRFTTNGMQFRNGEGGAWTNLTGPQIERLAGQSGMATPSTEDFVSHEDLIARAIAEGKPVPKPVLDEHNKMLADREDEPVLDLVDEVKPPAEEPKTSPQVPPRGRPAVKPDVAPAVPKELKAAGLAVTEKSSQKTGKPYWEISGKTFDHKDAIKTIPGAKFGGKVWRIFDADPTAKLVEALAEAKKSKAEKAAEWEGRLNPKAEAEPKVVGGRGLGEGVIGIQIKALRNKLDDMPSIAPVKPGRSVGQPTKALIQKGEGAIPQDVLDAQVEDIGKIGAAFRVGKSAFVLASDPGMGKTFVIAGALKEIARNHVGPLVWVTQNRRLIEQIKADIEPFGLNDRLQFLTYTDMSQIHAGKKTSDVKIDGAVIAWDEGHSVKNTSDAGEESGAARADLGQKYMGRAKFNILASATPFENPTQMGYIAASGVFDQLTEMTGLGRAISGTPFSDFALAFGAGQRKIRIKGGREKQILEWERGQTPAERKAQNENAMAARQWLEKQGMLAQREMKLEPGMVTTELKSVPPTEAQITLADRFTEAMTRAVEESGDSRVLRRNLAGYMTNTLKRIMEDAKVDAAIAEAKDVIAQGKQAVIFVETRAQKEITGRDYPAMRDAMDVWHQTGEDGKPPHSRFQLAVGQALHEAGLDEALESTVARIVKGVGADQTAIFTGDRTENAANADLDLWLDNKKPLLVATMAKGGTGLSLHSRRPGDPERVLIGLNMPWTATVMKQVLGRITRLGMLEPSEVRWLFLDHDFERVIAAKVGGRMQDMGAVVSGKVPDMGRDIERFDFDASTEGDAVDSAFGKDKVLDLGDPLDEDVPQFNREVTDEAATQIRTADEGQLGAREGRPGEARPRSILGTPGLAEGQGRKLGARSSAGEVQAAVEALNELVPTDSIVVHQAWDDLPQDLRNRMKDALETEAGIYDPKTQLVHVVADNMTSMADLLPIALHEDVHRGVHAMRDELADRLGGDVRAARDAVNAELNSIYLANRAAVQALASGVYKGQFDLGTAQGRAKATEEFLGQPEQQQGKWWDRYVSALRDFFRKVFEKLGLKLRMSEAETRDFVRRAHDASRRMRTGDVTKGEPTDLAAQFSRIRENPMTTMPEGERQFVLTVFGQHDRAMISLGNKVARLEKGIQKLAGVSHDSLKARRLSYAMWAYVDMKNAEASHVDPSARQPLADKVRDFKAWAATQAFEGDKKLRLEEAVRAVDQALSLTPEQKAFADTQMKAAFLDNTREMQRQGKLQRGTIDDYVYRWLEPDDAARPTESLEGGAGGGPVRTFSTSLMRRKYPTFLDAMMDGYWPAKGIREGGITASLNAVSSHAIKMASRERFLKDALASGFLRFKQAPGTVPLRERVLDVWKPTGDVHTTIRTDGIPMPLVDAVLNNSDTRVRNYSRKGFLTQPDVSWAVYMPNTTRAASVFDNQQDAIDFADQFQDARVEYRQDIVKFEKMPLYATPKVAEALHRMIGKQDSLFETVPALAAMRYFNATIKPAMLLGDFFHYLNLLRSDSMLGSYNTFSGVLRGGTTYDAQGLPTAAPDKSIVGRVFSPLRGGVESVRWLSHIEKGLSLIEQEHPVLMTLVQHGLTVPNATTMLGKTGLMSISESLARWTESRTLADFVKAAGILRGRAEHNLFGWLGAGLKSHWAYTRFMLEVSRAGQAANLNLIAERVASAANTAFGGQHLGRSAENKTLTHAKQLVLLAPDWLASQINTTLYAIPGLGRAIDSALGRMPIAPGTAKLYRKMFFAQLFYAAMGVILTQILLNAGGDEDTFALQKEQFEGLDYADPTTWTNWSAWGNVMKLKWTHADITRVYRKVSDVREQYGYAPLDIPPSARVTLNVGGVMLAPLRLLELGKFLSAKGSIMTRLVDGLITGTNWRGSPYKTTGEWIRSATHPDRPDAFAFTKGHGEENDRSLFQVPIIGLAWARDVQPLMLGQLFRALSGEQDGLTAFGKAMGLEISLARDPKILAKEFQEVKKLSQQSFKEFKRDIYRQSVDPKYGLENLEKNDYEAYVALILRRGIKRMDVMAGKMREVAEEASLNPNYKGEVRREKVAEALKNEKLCYSTLLTARETMMKGLESGKLKATKADLADAVRQAEADDAAEQK